MARVALFAALMLAPGGCIGVFADPAGAVSLGSNAHGALLRGVELPPDGAGYEVPAVLRPRGARWTTPEAAQWLSRSFASLTEVVGPDVRVPLGDLSRRRGGDAPGHRSHESGRDVDIFFLAVTSDGQRYFPEHAMLRFGADGWARSWSPPLGLPRPRAAVPAVRFDARGNWALVRALLSEPSAEVQFIFIHRALAVLLLEEASRLGEPPDLIERAEAIFQSPGHVDPHDDHMHVRIYCDPGDRSYGCVDHGTQRWWKKRWKYMPPADAERVPEPVVASAR